ncbi:MAG: hypothetical protein RIF32_16035 [Leptospirales bacterium]|jgi:hypothetical protein
MDANRFTAPRSSRPPPAARRGPLRFVGTLTLAGTLAIAGPAGLAADGAGGYDGPEGFGVVVLNKLEKSGVFSATWGGTFEIAAFKRGENCDEDEGHCYTPIARKQAFKLENESPVLINFLKENRGKEMFVRYNLPLFGDDWQLVDAMVWPKNPPRSTPDSVRVPPSGSRRDFVARGRVLRLQREGSVQKIWEGLYLDQDQRRVYPISITDEKVVVFLAQAMAARRSYFMGISVSYFPGFRNSTHDIYEINYARRPAPP